MESLVMPAGNKYLDSFMKVYSSLPIEERKLPVVVIDDSQINWGMAYVEIKNNTPLGGKIAEKLVNLKII